MNIGKELEPKNVFRFFEEICSIPHGSGNTKQISDYCVDFAKKRGLRFRQDEQNNVIIWKDATSGYENAEPIILQGHLDMVCEKEEGVSLDFATEGLQLYVDGDFLKAKGTTLGGDDGIAVAYALAILDSGEICHPPLEAVFTVDEEIGMLGAESIDVSGIKGRKLLNIDSDEEGVFLTSCAGGIRVDCQLPVSYVQAEGVCYEWKLHGLLGGHSGGEIHKERANAIVAAGRVLKALQDEVGIRIISLAGGLMDNAIPREMAASVLVGPKQEQKFLDKVNQWEEILKKEYQSSDPDLTITATKEDTGEYLVLDPDSMARVLLFLRCIPYGVQNMSLVIPGLVETSLNPGILKLRKDALALSFSIRSSITSRKYELVDRLDAFTKFLGGKMAVSGDYPAWEYKEESRLRQLVGDCYRELFHEEPKIQAIHAGLECGILSGKLEGLDCISFGPNNFDIHTPQERLSISSTKRVWELILEVLRRAK